MVPPIVRLVNGEHRLGIFACECCKFYMLYFKGQPGPVRKLSPGTEILLDYGDEFFPPECGATKPPDSTLDQTVYQLDQHSSDETYNE